MKYKKFFLLFYYFLFFYKIKIYANIDHQLESNFYMKQCSQFHLWHLPTEGFNEKTMNFSKIIKNDTNLGIRNLISVEKDIIKAINNIINNQNNILTKINNLSLSIENAILNNKKIYIYGCGSTGRLAKQLAFIWRNFWHTHKYRLSLNKNLNLHKSIVGIITGGDRALISSIEGFEDLELIGNLQIKNVNLTPQDVVIGVTEGGETSSVIGAVEEATKNIQDTNNIYFILNNPIKNLYYLSRSKKILINNQINKISLFTGAQAITGSTRMQATTISSFIIGLAIEQSIKNILIKSHYSNFQLQKIGFNNDSIKTKLLRFKSLYSNLENIFYEFNPIINEEFLAYKKNKNFVYTGISSIVTIFSDITERSPTFGIIPIDTNFHNNKNSINKVICLEDNLDLSWYSLLLDQFEGLNYMQYKQEFSNKLPNKIKSLAINGLKNALNNQKNKYNFSYNYFIKNVSSNVQHCVIYILPEDIYHIKKIYKFIQLLISNNISFSIINLSTIKLDHKITHNANKYIINYPLKDPDPIGLNVRIFLKMILNTQSTSVMAKLGYLTGNAMTHLKPANMKLIGRATNLITYLVNNKIDHKYIVRHNKANELLFKSMSYKKENKSSHSEISLSIIKILESIKHNKCIEFQDIETILNNISLEDYLAQYVL